MGLLSNLLRKKDSEPIYEEEVYATYAEHHVAPRIELKDRIFLLENGDLGVVWEFDGLNDEVMTEIELQDELKPFASIMRYVVGIPRNEELKNLTFQVIQQNRRIDENAIPPKKQKEHDYTFSKTSTGELLAAEERFLFQNVPFVSQKFFLCARLSYHIDDRGVIKKLIDETKLGLKSLLQKEVQDKNLVEFDSKAKSFLTFVKEVEQIYPALKRLESTAVTEIIQNTLSSGNPCPTRPDKYFVSKGVFVPGLVPATPNNDGHPEGFGYESDRGSSEVYVLDKIPQGGNLDSPSFKFGQFRHFVDALHARGVLDFDLVWVIAKGQKGLDPKTKGLAQLYGGKKALKKIEAMENIAVYEQKAESEPCCRFSLRLLVHNPTEETYSQVQTASDEYLRVEFPREEHIPHHMAITSLLLGAARDKVDLKSRSRSLNIEDALLFMPIFSGPSQEHGTFWYRSRNGTPTRFDLFAGEGNKMACVLATTRAGKGVFTNIQVAFMLDRFLDSRVIVVDFRTSFEKQCNLHGSKVIDFSIETLKENPYSPFAMENPDKDDINSLRDLIFTAILFRNDNINIQEPHRQLLSQALLKCYFESEFSDLANEYFQNDTVSEAKPHPTWTDVLKKLPEVQQEMESGGKNLNKYVEDLDSWTMAFRQGGNWDFIFDAAEKKKRSIDQRLIVFDIAGVTDPKLRAICTMMISTKIFSDLRKISKTCRKLLIFDELGQQIGGSGNGAFSNAAAQMMGETITNVVATAAKYNGQVLALTNQVNDYAKNPAGQALWSLSSTKIFLPLGSLYQEAKKFWGGEDSDFNDADWSILRTLKKQPPTESNPVPRSMGYIISNNEEAPYRGSFEIPLSPDMDALCTTSGSQLELYKHLKEEKQMQTLEALQYMSEKHPYGKGLSQDKRDLESTATHSVDELEGDNEQ